MRDMIQQLTRHILQKRNILKHSSATEILTDEEDETHFSKAFAAYTTSPERSLEQVHLQKGRSVRRF